MQIPLDYYRILGLPIQATADQLQQAHRDRGLQLPRREFSPAAIEARKQLIDEAYTVLSNPDRRRSYDGKFLASGGEDDTVHILDVKTGTLVHTIQELLGHITALIFSPDGHRLVLGSDDGLPRSPVRSCGPRGRRWSGSQAPRPACHSGA